MNKKIIAINAGPRMGWPWSMFDPEAKKLRHETVFPQECSKAYGMGAALVTKSNAT